MRRELKSFCLKALEGIREIFLIGGIALSVAVLTIVIGVGIFLACWSIFDLFLTPTIMVVATILSFVFAKVLKGFFHPKMKEKEEEQEAAPVLPRARTVGRIFKNGVKGPQSQMARYFVRCSVCSKR